MSLSLARDDFSVVLTPLHEAIISSEVKSEVLRVHREFGQSFRTGQVLVELDTVQYRLNLEKAQVLVEAARAVYEITANLYQKGTASKLEIEKAKMELSVAEVSKKFALRDLASCRVVAPYNGRVEKPLVNEREWVDVGRPLMKIVDDSVLRARIILPTEMFGSIKLGQPLKVMIRETGAAVTAKVSHVSAVMDAASATFEVYAEVENAGGHLRTGMTGRLLPAGAGN